MKTKLKTLPLSAFAGFSLFELNYAAERAAQLAVDMQKDKPSLQLAEANGVINESYSLFEGAVHISSWSGKADVTMANGDIWHCVGHRCKGGADYVSKRGWVEFTKVYEKPAPDYSIDTACRIVLEKVHYAEILKSAEAQRVSMLKRPHHDGEQTVFVFEDGSKLVFNAFYFDCE